ncbi:M23 family metallopeptidase [Streptomyces griseoviridis]|jgi:murein DD-endopeptidase MepM/ murein hydrolase activator NlpD|uniref:Murein DD-endopeptidase MepM/ murein hydrolase activator NlpD n=1 Tax=Streptomyces griseoviridis TaxID=45398 RepID=A0ABT9LGQ9_STRGD|nr:M23 family metallopeptidase [Streptomyces griseoviridis]MDP9682858.1 murein DD-endopeptidase MepM/ murein hydrolase activator NlpD [Streptomyces griseoviridis]GGS91200.1 peptidase [Streptomyces griseoviridis]
MRSPRRRPLLVPVLLCALAVLAARPTAEGDGGSAGEAGTEVARLYQDAATATRRYEEGRREAEARRAEAARYAALLDRQRAEITVLHEELGRIARAQYREGGGLPLTARMLLADDPEQLMRGRHTIRRAGRALGDAIGRSRRAEARLAADEARAEAARRELDRHNAELATLKRSIERKLAAARAKLRDRAETPAAAGSCPGAVRLDQPDARAERDWVAPVEAYELSASFGSGGSRWANRHTGQDFAVPVGTPVRAVGAGHVVKVSCGGAFGIQVVLRHSGGYYTQYAHLAAVAVGQGDRVAAGQWIGQSGNTGNSTGPHLHFEVRITPETGSALNPVPWLALRGVTV